MTRTRRETELRKEPYPDAESLGILPSKSLVTLTGEEKGNFLGVEVELEEGSLTGWIDSSAIKKTVLEEAPEAAEPGGPKVIKTRKTKKKKKTIPVPSDEGILLRRNPTFSYGAFVGVHYDMITVADEEVQDVVGTGLAGGATLSFLLDPSFRLRTELGYTTHSGMNANDRFVSFTFLDLAAIGELSLGESFFIFGGFQYSAGLGFDNEESVISNDALSSASDVSGIWGQGGVGYRFNASESSFLSIRLKYQGALGTSSLVGFHAFGGQLVWEIEG